MPECWVLLSHAIPYTRGAHGFIHINTMGASLWTTREEYTALWILTAVYFPVSCLLLFITGYLHEREHERTFHERLNRKIMKLRRINAAIGRELRED